MHQSASQRLSQFRTYPSNDMSNNVVTSCARSFASCCLGSVRIILFLLCLIFLFIAFFGLIATLSGPTNSPLEVIVPDTLKSSRSGMSWFDPFLLLLGALLGCYGTLYKHPQSIKLFSLFMACYLCYAIISSASSNDYHKYMKEFNTRMTNYMEDYTWDYSSNEYLWNNSTLAWNKVQFFGCCGMDGPQDWIKFRPPNFAKQYPRSCCRGSPPSCYISHDLYITGCSELAKAPYIIGAFFVLIVFIFMVILTILGCILGVSGFGAPEARSPYPPESGISNPGQCYERFAVPAFARQPPTNESFEPKAPSLYPTVPTIQKTENTYSGPPPVYTSGHM